MSTMTATRPCIEIPSRSLPGEVRHVSLDLGSCDCPGFMFNGGQCWHIDEARRLTGRAERMCSVCGLNPVWDGFSRCVSCAALPVGPMPLPVPRPQQISCGWPVFAHCCDCGARYAYSDDNPLYCRTCASATSGQHVA
ncbi:MAG: hypothetical protein JWP44_4531 [Mucilaginibacter sp.]|nr:hypothetical protein [Mucilaginibacter sp.]